AQRCATQAALIGLFDRNSLRIQGNFLLYGGAATSGILSVAEPPRDCGACSLLWPRKPSQRPAPYLCLAVPNCSSLRILLYLSKQQPYRDISRINGERTGARALALSRFSQNAR